MVQLDPVRHVHLPGSTVRMTNYVSLGVDALVTLNFHKTRESPHYLWSSRLVNKLIYFCYGTKDVLERECQHLQQKLTLKMDGREVELPDIEALVVQNIATWGAGVRPWELGQGAGAAGVQRPDDGLLEVFCVYSSFHIAQMQVGLSEPLRLGQARSVEISLRSKVPMQLDGEPWEQGPCVIRVSHHNQARMLRMSRA
ncbi:Diacylglycerol kinase epsilon [Amphibalanus amphitrite]|uniref:Diacylglycerol kinase epsilon n=1 Tax=Amphibalanus amphitrite TaxID=1232801 RepID=A0A6A4WHV8_AMPAM|nr:Diacylglycerol kinase epsilon [Amphibalanus amphitrite]